MLWKISSFIQNLVGVWIKITSTHPYREVLYLQGIDKRVIRLAQTNGLEISPIQDGGQLKWTSLIRLGWPIHP